MLGRVVGRHINASLVFFEHMEWLWQNRMIDFESTSTTSMLCILFYDMRFSCLSKGESTHRVWIEVDYFKRQFIHSTFTFKFHDGMHEQKSNFVECRIYSRDTSFFQPSNNFVDDLYAKLQVCIALGWWKNLNFPHNMLIFPVRQRIVARDISKIGGCALKRLFWASFLFNLFSAVQISHQKPEFRVCEAYSYFGEHKEFWCRSDGKKSPVRFPTGSQIRNRGRHR